jgi:uncharacterized Fe-S cluster-containing radical SAM superfamily protein
MSPIQTEAFSSHLREKAILPVERKVLISRLQGSEQEKDLHTPVNCDGYGRIHTFVLQKYPDWSANPLPIIPAARALGFSPDSTLRVQVFQNAACNWRCWYCFVDFSLLAANPRLSDFFTAEELIGKFLQEKDRPLVLDLSGGQPDIVPEWLIWTMEALEQQRLAGKIFLWSDDNLSGRYFWKYLSQEQRSYATRFPKYARVGCFKGYDETSFAFNTNADPKLFLQQFEIYRDLLQEGFDMYAYVTFTALPHANVDQTVERFVDQLQKIHHNLPLRTIPLKIEIFRPTSRRMKEGQKAALEFQHTIHAAWLEVLKKRFLSEERLLPICDVPLFL